MSEVPEEKEEYVEIRTETDSDIRIPDQPASDTIEPSSDSTPPTDSFPEDEGVSLEELEGEDVVRDVLGRHNREQVKNEIISRMESFRQTIKDFNRITYEVYTNLGYLLSKIDEVDQKFNDVQEKFVENDLV